MGLDMGTMVVAGQYADPPGTPEPLPNKFHCPTRLRLLLCHIIAYIGLPNIRSSYIGLEMRLPLYPVVDAVVFYVSLYRNFPHVSG